MTSAVQDAPAAVGTLPAMLADDRVQVEQLQQQQAQVDSKLNKKQGKRAQQEAPVDSVSLRKLFSLADRTDKVLMFVGVLAALVTACGMPFFLVYFGKTLDGLNDTSGGIESIVRDFCIIFLVTGAATAVAGTVQVATWTLAGNRQALRMKERYVAAILRQDVGWFDEHPAGQLPTMITSLMVKIQDGIGRKVPETVMNGAGAVGCLIAALYLNPVLAGILLACVPIIGVTTGVVIKVMSQSTLEGQTHYGRAGAVANEVFAGVRTVASLCSEPWELKRYTQHLLSAEKSGIKNGLQNGLGQGVMFCAFYLSYALAFWYGLKQVADNLASGCDPDTESCASGGKVISAVFGIIIASSQLGLMSPNITALSLARTSAVAVFSTIDRVPPIDSASKEGLQPSSVSGALHIDNIAFAYPARKDDAVYTSVSLTVAIGETLALVGPSGGGKSTMTKLLLRFYDPTAGCIRLDGNDIRTLNLNWYRQQIGYVGQEPVLFSGTIHTNILNGKPGASDAEIVEAAKAANAHDFIKAFPQGYATQCGDGGIQLSGGQKQRIAIARAIIKDPAILLLDEATSALDSQSEAVVQRALEHLQQLKRRTTITIAHRLSTIQNSDRIAVMANKGVAELGTHTELLALGGIYAQLCASQSGGATSPLTAAAAAGAGTDSQNAALADTDTVSSSSIQKKGRSSSFLNTQRQRSASSSAVAQMGASETNGDSAPTKLSLKEQQAAALKQLPLTPLSRLWSLNKADLHWILLGLVGATLTGCLFPVQGIIMANLQNVFYNPDPGELRRIGNLWVLGFLALAAAAVIGHVSQAYGFATAGERMTRRLRQTAFEAILRHDIGWFDHEGNSTGPLTTRLEEDASTMAKATGVSLGHKVQLLMTLLLGVTVALIVAWQVGLVAMACIPLIGLGGVIQMAMFTQKSGIDDAEGSTAGIVLGSALNGITTVQAFNMQKSMSGRYNAAIASSAHKDEKRVFLNGAAFGYSQGVVFWVFALLFWYGSDLVSSGEVTFLAYFTAMFAVIMGATGIGQVNADLGAQKAGQQAATRVFALSDEPFKIDPMSTSGAKPAQLSGAISFQDIRFAYPTRPNQPIYNGFSLTVKAGDTVALCGPSGGGKSTCISLLMRFYDCDSGCISVDGRSIKELNVHWLRSQIGYVGQEPVLFTGSIQDNIAKGMPGASLDDIQNAARSANAHDFIMAFKDGYNTDVGEKSALLSGGQKQRIALARAILKNPSILLLDEATSALDNESEKQVQAALDHLQRLQRRTTLVVAHRLSTIRNADKIAVLSGGTVSELGTHAELMAISGGTYASMYHKQTDMFSQ